MQICLEETGSTHIKTKNKVDMDYVTDGRRGAAQFLASDNRFQKL